jgi:hypothetical protein
VVRDALRAAFPTRKGAAASGGLFPFAGRGSDQSRDCEKPRKSNKFHAKARSRKERLVCFFGSRRLCEHQQPSPGASSRFFVRMRLPPAFAEGDHQAAADLNFRDKGSHANFAPTHPAVELEIAYGSSGNFAQIGNGAPFDVPSADVDYPRGCIRRRRFGN